MAVDSHRVHAARDLCRGCFDRDRLREHRRGQIQESAAHQRTQVRRRVEPRARETGGIGERSAAEFDRTRENGLPEAAHPPEPGLREVGGPFELGVVESGVGPELRPVETCGPTEDRPAEPGRSGERGAHEPGVAGERRPAETCRSRERDADEAGVAGERGTHEPGLSESGISTDGIADGVEQGAQKILTERCAAKVHIRARAEGGQAGCAVGRGEVGQAGGTAAGADASAADGIGQYRHRRRSVSRTAGWW